MQREDRLQRTTTADPRNVGTHATSLNISSTLLLFPMTKQVKNALDPLEPIEVLHRQYHLPWGRNTGAFSREMYRTQRRPIGASTLLATLPLSKGAPMGKSVNISAWTA
jgi:hypothetical protein